MVTTQILHQCNGSHHHSIILHRASCPMCRQRLDGGEEGAEEEGEHEEVEVEGEGQEEEGQEED